MSPSSVRPRSWSPRSGCAGSASSAGSPRSRRWRSERCCRCCPPTPGSTDIAVRYQAAGEDTLIGGDLYDCYHSRTHTRFLLGDVRGKGMGAVEQAARVIRAFRQAAAIQPSLDAVAEDMTSYLNPFFDDEEFVTALLLDTTDAARPRLVNAGHPPPLLVRPDGACDFLETEADLPLGLGERYASHDFAWRPGDRLLLYTDGVSEARDSNGAFLDLRELGPVLVGGTVEAALDRLLDAVRAHAARGELSDDVAVLLLEHTVTGSDYRPSAGEHDWRTLAPGSVAMRRRRASHPGDVGRPIVTRLTTTCTPAGACARPAPVAQWIEQPPPKRKVASSTLAWGTAGEHDPRRRASSGQ